MKRRWIDTAFARSLTVLLVLLIAIVLVSRGFEAETRPSKLAKLAREQGVETIVQEPEIILLVNEETKLVSTVENTLDQMKIGWRDMQIGQFSVAALGDVKTVLVCTNDLSGMDDELLVGLIAWTEDGGRLAMMNAPMTGDWFLIVNRKLGIIDYRRGYARYTTLRFEDGLLPLVETQVIDEALQDYALSVRLEPDCRIYMETNDEEQIPLLWTREVGDGRVAVFNTNLIQGKDTRGYVLNILSVLEDVLVYPIINAGMVFIDDFPAPQTDGVNERLKEQYGYDIQGFYRNHWWPDMKNLSWKLGIRYTGVLIETYNDTMEPPFEPERMERALIRYYTSELLDSGGEVGLHGYNHQPLCLDSSLYADEGYQPWADTDAMKLSIEELLRYGKSFLPNAAFATYVPPSNYLSQEGESVLVEAVPELTTISGVYLPEAGRKAFTQEFGENDSGVIEVPRITSGYSLDAYNRLLLSQELALHGVLSHFIHPDDVLDENRGAELGWAKLYDDFGTTMEEAINAYPMLRWSTAAEGAAAVQRYARVQVQRLETEDALELTLSPFYDEVWLALWCKNPPAAVENAVIYEVEDGFYWIQATDANVRLEWGASE